MGFKGKKILVTGGCGFIGSHIVNNLKEDNEVYILDNMKTKSTEFRVTTLRLPKIVTDKMKEHSKKINGCPRPVVGSINHFMVHAVLKVLKENGDNFKYLYPEYYQ